MLWGERRGQWHHRRSSESTERPMPQLNDLSRSLVILEQDATLIAVIEMGQSSWLVAGIVPGVERQPLKKLAVDESALLKLLNRWREQAAGQLVISVDTKEELIGNFRTAARTIGPRAARSTLRSVALFCRVLGEAF